MTDLRPVHDVLTRVRRRLRLQAALEWSTTALIPAIVCALVVLWFWRMDYLTDGGAGALWALCALFVVGCGVVGASHGLPTHVVANRVDRASGLADRLGTACDFAVRLAEVQHEHPDTIKMMNLAVTDGVHAAQRADVPASAPLGAPRDSKAALLFVVAFAAVASLGFAPKPGKMPFVFGDFLLSPADKGHAAEAVTLDDVDAEITEEMVETLKRMADEEGDAHLKNFARQLEDLLRRTENGELTKAEMLAEMDKLEKKYNESAGENLKATVDELKQAGKDLKQEAATKKLGEALEKGDLDAAQKEFEKLAEKIENNELSDKQMEQLAKSMEKVAKKIDKRQQEQAEKAQKQVDKAKRELNKLRKQAQQDPKNQELRRRLDKKERELKKLERKQQQQQAQQRKRQLQRLQRNLKKAAENLRNKNQKAQKQMRQAARDIRDIQDEQRQQSTQQKARSQLQDLKDALRRAKMKKKGKGNDARARRLRRFKRRASGQRGQRPGQKPGQRGNRPGQKGNRPGQKGNKPGQGNKPGDGQGDQDDPDLMGNETDRYGDNKDEKLTGVHGKGPSRRDTILTSAKKGFATSAYKNVYSNYRKVVEDVMQQEKVPQGYKYYVKRYFQRIKPR